jgi:outer membrane protein assembly factor BamA
MYNLSEKDTISPQSLTGGLLMYTTNRSWFGMVFNRTYFNEDKYRATLAVGTGVVNYQFFMSEPFDLGYIDYNVDMDFLFVELQRKVFGNLYFGLNYKYAKMLTVIPEFESPEGVIIPGHEETVVLNGLGAVFSYDGRDDVYYPYSGMISDLNFSAVPDFMGNEFVSQKIELDYNHFLGLRKNKDVFAARFYGGAGIGELSFNQQFVVGGEDIRGYTQGKYRGEQIIALQAEYRWNPYEKIGFVGFIGSAMVFNGINSEDEGKLLPAIGTGFRYTVFPENHMNVGIDIAAGKDDWGIYFRIGESF